MCGHWDAGVGCARNDVERDRREEVRGQTGGGKTQARRSRKMRDIWTGFGRGRPEVLETGAIVMTESWVKGSLSE